MSAVDTVKVAKYGATTPAPFNIAFQDKDGTGASLAPIHALRNSSGVDIDPATSELQSSVQSAPGTPQTAAVSIQGNAAAIPVPVSDGGSPITGASIPAGGVGLTGWLSAIWSKLSGTLSVSWSGQSVAVSNFPSSQTVAGSVLVSNLPATQAISAAALPLPSGAAHETGGNLASIATNVSTAANQTTANTTLASILTKLGAVVLSTGSAIIGKVGIDQTTPGTTNGVVINSGSLSAALSTGSNIIGYAGSLNFQTAPVVPTIQAAAYASGNVIGGKQTVSVFRTTGQPSATLAQFLLGWAGTETVAITVYLFSKNPTGSTITDKAAFVLAAADAQYLAAAPFTLTAAAPGAGTTQTFASQSLSLSVQNRDSTATQNLYVVLVVGGAVTPAVGDLFFSISGVQD